MVAASLTLAFTAWALGGVRLWALHIILAGGLLTFLLAVVPLPARLNGSDGEHGNRKNVMRLLKWPFFWFSLAFLIYIVIQGLNPSWTQERSDAGWWVEEIKAISWLPSGVRSDYEPMNAFRVLANFGAAFSLVWGIWSGIRRRSSAVIVAWSLILSGVGMAIMGILQKFTGAEAVFWTVPSPNAQFWGSFFYRNQGGAYLNLIMIGSAVLYFYHFNRSEERGQHGGPHLLLFVFVAVIATSVGLALSRGGILFGGIFAACFFVAAVGRWIFSTSTRNSVLLTLVIAGLLGAGGFGVVRYIDIGDIEKRFGDIEEAIATADEDSRALTTKITWRMAQDELWLGWGAGSWRYIFPMYQKSYPEIYYVRYHRIRGWEGRKFFRYAHNDVVQFLFEFGIVGYGILILAFGYWVWSLLVRASGNALSALMLLVGFGVMVGHAFVDFIFQSPSYWLAFNGLLCVCVKLLALHSERSYR